MIRQRALAWAERYAARRAPDFAIGPEDAPQLQRWWLIPRNRWFNLYLHRFLRSDEGRALHDHMYVNLSWILGPHGYYEITPVGRTPWYPTSGLASTIGLWRPAGKLVARRPTTAHRVVLLSAEPVYSLFVTGPAVREWGFWCPQGFRHWREFVSERPGGNGAGRGCE